MSIEILVPALGESVSEATVAKWYKKAGDAVKLDELIVELETEKVTLEVSASAEGTLESVLKKVGDVVAVGELLGSIKAGAISVSAATSKLSPNTQSQSTSIASSVSREEKKVDKLTTMPPSVQKLVTENNLNPATIAGTGKDGRINKGDILNVLELFRLILGLSL